MRTIEEFRARLLDDIHQALKRPALYGGNASGTQMFFHYSLADLEYIDEREGRIYRDLGDDTLSPLGFFGHFVEQKHLLWPPFQWRKVVKPDTAEWCDCHVASCFAEVVFRRGYDIPKRLLTPEEMLRLRQRVEGEFFERDWTIPELEHEFGECSHSTGETRCYGCSSLEHRWVFFDFISRDSEDDTEQIPTEPVLYDVRFGGTKNKLHLLPFAKQMLKTKPRHKKS